MKVKKLFLIRHGQTEWNQNGAEMGQIYHIPINQVGHQQAQKVAKAVSREENIKRIISSDLMRASQTASYIGVALGIEVEYDIRLREQKTGLLQGLSPAEAQEQYPDILMKLSKNPLNYKIPEGESGNEVLKRVVDCIEESILACNGDLLVVTHGKALARFTEYALGIDPKVSNKMCRINCGLNIFRVDRKGYTLLRWGEV